MASVGLVDSLEGEQLALEPSLGDGELAVVDVEDGSVDLGTKDVPDFPVELELVHSSTGGAEDSGPFASNDERLVGQVPVVGMVGFESGLRIVEELGVLDKVHVLAVGDVWGVSGESRWLWHGVESKVRRV